MEKKRARRITCANQGFAHRSTTMARWKTGVNAFAFQDAVIRALSTTMFASCEWFQDCVSMFPLPTNAT